MTMRAFARFFKTFVLLSCVVCWCRAEAAPAETPNPSVSTRKPVIVELFTSEGCSDCPPADELLKNLELQQPIPRVEVIAIEEHVDYWNHDGWVDPFSSPEWTLRQQDYVTKLRAGTEYTPQMVVDGESQLVGSFAAAAERTIEIASLSPQVPVTLTPGNSDGKDAQEFSVSVGNLAAAKAQSDAEVWLAVTEDGLHSSVSAGENAGHVLYHAAVLRSLQKVGVAKANSQSGFSGSARVKFNSHWNRANLHVVAFVQEKHSLKILGATSTQVAAAQN
ncbi:MAG TPA: DUF1223 domain-containing protein [Candidatus Dormibacteraeota bacterium]|nr:DUF1223 domain-containing protein [Candidatus Dormibacteraeota bacterium]